MELTRKERGRTGAYRLPYPSPISPRGGEGNTVRTRTSLVRRSGWVLDGGTAAPNPEGISRPWEPGSMGRAFSRQAGSRFNDGEGRMGKLDPERLIMEHDVLAPTTIRRTEPHVSRQGRDPRERERGERLPISGWTAARALVPSAGHRRVGSSTRRTCLRRLEHLRSVERWANLGSVGGVCEEGARQQRRFLHPSRPGRSAWTACDLGPPPAPVTGPAPSRGSSASRRAARSSAVPESAETRRR